MSLYDAGPFTAVAADKFGYSGTPVFASAITYTLNVNTPEGILTLTPVAPQNPRPPRPYTTHGAPVGSLALVQFVGGVAQIFLQEWPAAKVCEP